MVDDIAFGSDSAGSWTGVHAPLIATGFVLRTVCAHYTLGSTGRWAS